MKKNDKMGLIILRNDPAKRKKLGKVKDLWEEHQADKDDRLYNEWVDREAINKSMKKKRGNK